MTSTSHSPHFGLGLPLRDGLGSLLARGWWLLLLRGIAAIALAIFAFAWPQLTALSLTFAWAAYVFVDGLFSLGMAISRRGIGLGLRVWLIVLGLLGVVAGLFAFAAPVFALRILTLYVGVWAVLAGIAQIVGAIHLRKEIKGEWLLMIAGLLAIGLGVAMVLRPYLGALTIAWMIGFYALIAGLDHVALAFRVRRARA